jgi:hypothetical protein
MTTENALNSNLKAIKELCYDKCSFVLTHLKINSAGIEYGACSFELDGQKIIGRVSKITPTKTGQFVTIWKRNKKGTTEPFDIQDDFEFIIIISKSGESIGKFVFPKSVLAEKGIISQDKKNGKRGIRVYPPWDTVTNKQAAKTQNWQVKYFVTIERDDIATLDFMRKLLQPKLTV